MKITIDRIEGAYAVVLTDEGKSMLILKELFPDGKEGDVYDISRDDAETEKRSKRIRKLMDEVWE